MAKGKGRLTPVTGVDAVIDAQEVSVADMSRAETDPGSARVDVILVVDVVRDAEVAGVLCTVRI